MGTEDVENVRRTKSRGIKFDVRKVPTIHATTWMKFCVNAAKKRIVEQVKSIQLNRRSIMSIISMVLVSSRCLFSWYGRDLG